MHEARCMCELIPRLETRTKVVVVMHCREWEKTTATAPLALAALPNSELHIHGARDSRADLSHLSREDRRLLLLYPSEGASPLTSELVSQDPRPVTLIVPDGNWRQAARAARRLPGLAEVERVFLPEGRPTAWGLRQEPKPGGLATIEAIARALGVLESREIEEQLERLLAENVYRTHLTRGASQKEWNDPVQILYQDDDLLVINKPSGLPVHRGRGVETPPLLQRLRDQMGEWVYPVHRLDGGTSGALLIARTPEIAARLSQQFEAGSVEKRYLALCRGKDPTLTRVEHALAREDGTERVPAVTDLTFLGSFERYGLYEVRPKTGRKHQIRLHLKHMSHPIIGDVRYGKGEHNMLFRERFGFHRLALHALSLRFTSPRTGEPIYVEAPLPFEFRSLLEAIGLAEFASGAPVDPVRSPASTDGA
jgi:tRNA pseudouridine65 synthase